ncbi:MAG: imidazolonepropionase [Pseudomonadota bacterium]
MILSQATLAPLTASDSFGLISDGAMVIEDGRIVWVGQGADLPTKYHDAPKENLAGRLITPGIIDCHTHLVFGGDRSGEFEQLLQGTSYSAIAQAGGGIASTVRATRAASEEALLDDALKRLDAMICEGVTTVEIKSGYGLDIDTELKMLRVARRLGALRPITIRTTFLGAHSVPLEYAGKPDAYIDMICLPALRKAHAAGLVDAVDGFCEGIAFDAAQIGRVFDLARSLGLPVKLHAEQLSNTGGAQLAAQAGALSADHLEYATDADAQAMAASGTVATLLPGAYYTLRETQMPPVDAFRAAGVCMAVSTDCNPGSSPLTSPLLAMNMACTLFRLTPLEALRGVTAIAARALGMQNCGTLAPGMRADLCIWDVTHPSELAYRIGFNPLYRRIFGGPP